MRTPCPTTATASFNKLYIPWAVQNPPSPVIRGKTKSRRPLSPVHPVCLLVSQLPASFYASQISAPRSQTNIENFRSHYFPSPPHPCLYTRSKNSFLSTATSPSSPFEKPIITSIPSVPTIAPKRSNLKSPRSRKICTISVYIFSTPQPPRNHEPSFLSYGFPK